MPCPHSRGNQCESCRNAHLSLSRCVLAIHAELMTLLAMLLSRRARGIPHEDVAELIRTFVVRTELSVQSRFDGRNYVVQLIDRFLK